MLNPSYPYPAWWDFTVSGPVLPDFYWNVKSQEERIKKICEDLWKLIQLYKMLVDAINNHEERIDSLEERMDAVEAAIADIYNKLQQIFNTLNNHEQRITRLEEAIDEINSTLQNILNRLRAIEEFLDDIDSYIDNRVRNYLDEHLEDIINELLEGILDEYMKKVPTATLDHIATFDSNGQVKDGGKTIAQIIQEIIQAIQQDIPDVSGKVDKVPMQENMIVLADGNGGIKSSSLLFGNRYIESTAANAQADSLANPLSLVYVPETPNT